MAVLPDPDKIARVAKRLLIEFWFPFLIAVGWTCYSFSQSESDWSLAKAIASFSTSFFLASWATGQFVRVKRQQTVENTLQTVQGSLRTVEQTVENGFNDVKSALGTLRQQAEHIPGLKPFIEDLATVTQTANSQVTAANTAVSEVLRHGLTAGLGWASDWPVPRRPPPNPAIYNIGVAMPPSGMPPSSPQSTEAADGSTATVRGSGRSMFDDVPGTTTDKAGGTGSD